jgi:hypothetical protein
MQFSICCDIHLSRLTEQNVLKKYAICLTFISSLGDYQPIIRLEVIPRLQAKQRILGLEEELAMRDQAIHFRSHTRSRLLIPISRNQSHT